MYIFFSFTVVQWHQFEQSSRVLGNIRALGPEQGPAAGPVFEQPVCQGSLSVETPWVSSSASKFLAELIWCFCFSSLKDGRKTCNTTKLCPVLYISVYRWKSPGPSLVRTDSGDSSQGTPPKCYYSALHVMTHISETCACTVSGPFWIK